MNTQINEILICNLRRLRHKHRYSQQDIAAVLSISQPSYNRIESGKTELRLAFIYKLARFYNVFIDDLLENNAGRLSHT